MFGDLISVTLLAKNKFADSTSSLRKLVAESEYSPLQKYNEDEYTAKISICQYVLPCGIILA